MALSKAENVKVQKECNHFASVFLEDVTPLHVDGVIGKATCSRIMRIKYYLGYGKSRDCDITRLFRLRMTHPHSRRYFTSNMWNSGRERRSAQRTAALNHGLKASGTKGVVLLDGHYVAEWIAKEVLRIREAGRWKGVIASGWRDPVYSEGLCYNMCGAPSCSGRCAGRSSNHSGIYKPAGAVDVTQYDVFRAECKRLNSPLHNALPNDLVHFSMSGH